MLVHMVTRLGLQVQSSLIPPPCVGCLGQAPLPWSPRSRRSTTTTTAVAKRRTRRWSNASWTSRRGSPRTPTVSRAKRRVLRVSEFEVRLIEASFQTTGCGIDRFSGPSEGAGCDHTEGKSHDIALCMTSPAGTALTGGRESAGPEDPTLTDRWVHLVHGEASAVLTGGGSA
jgi:hypothetical protein